MDQAVRLNIGTLREQAGVTHSWLAYKLDLPETIVWRLEAGQGNPRVGVVLRFALELGVLLNRAPHEVLQDLIPDAAFSSVSDVYNLSRMTMPEPAESFTSHVFEPDDERETVETSLARTRRLLEKTRYTKPELAEITGLSLRYLKGRLEWASSVAWDLGFADFLRLVAALAPAYGGSTEETFYYLIGDDLFDIESLALLRLQ